MRCARLKFKFNNGDTIDLFKKIREIERLDLTYDIDISYLKVQILEFNQNVLIGNPLGYMMNVILDNVTEEEIKCPIYKDIPIEFNKVKIDICKFENINNSVETFIVDYIY